jgi:hypothetical protein
MWVVAFLCTGDGDLHDEGNSAAFRNVSRESIIPVCRVLAHEDRHDDGGCERVMMSPILRKKALLRPEAEQGTQSVRDLSARPCLAWAFLDRAVREVDEGAWQRPSEAKHQ